MRISDIFVLPDCSPPGGLVHITFGSAKPLIGEIKVHIERSHNFGGARYFRFLEDVKLISAKHNGAYVYTISCHAPKDFPTERLCVFDGVVEVDGAKFNFSFHYKNKQETWERFQQQVQKLDEFLMQSGIANEGQVYKEAGEVLRRNVLDDPLGIRDKL